MVLINVVEFNKRRKITGGKKKQKTLFCHAFSAYVISLYFNDRLFIFCSHKMNFLNYSAFWLARAFEDVRIIEPNRKCHRIDKMWEKSHWFFFKPTLSMDYVEWKTGNFVTLNRTNAKYELYRSNQRVWSFHIFKTTINVFLGKIFF